MLVFRVEGISMRSLLVKQSVFWAVLLVAAGIGCIRCTGQTAGLAQISGDVRDPTGASIAGAQVKVTQIERKLDREIVSDSQGRYVAPELPVGPYQIEVTAN